MRHINPVKAGTAVGTVIGLWHVAWATFVLAGWAKPIMDFVLRLHFLRFDYEMAPFSFGTAGALVAVTFAVGWLFGFVFAVVWNWLAAPVTTASGGVTAQA